MLQLIVVMSSISYVKLRCGEITFVKMKFTLLCVTIKFLDPKIWELIPGVMKDLESLPAFKGAIKHWKPTSCPSRLCKQYFYKTGFL